MENKGYSLNIDSSGNVNFQFDKACSSFYGSPVNATSKVSVELIPATKNEPASLVKTTVIKEKYRLREREIQKEDWNFALNLIANNHSMLTLNLLTAEENFPGSISLLKISKVKDREDTFKILLDFEYDQYFEGELASKKIKEKAAFVVNKEKIEEVYKDFKNLSIKQSISLLQVLKQLLKECIIPEECESIKAIKVDEPIKEKSKSKGIEIDDD